ncbi:unnamed protein product [Citrullus colocynthis]|uniref:Uncharacterized protein n=1 Tax=Citrullus colocynthis TaxID=252529 RepID=A0ABP0YQ90_9ROSI
MEVALKLLPRSITINPKSFQFFVFCPTMAAIFPPNLGLRSSAPNSLFFLLHIFPFLILPHASCLALIWTLFTELGALEELSALPFHLRSFIIYHSW